MDEPMSRSRMRRESAMRGEELGPDLLGFWRALVQRFGFGGSLTLEGDTFEELAEQHGLIRWEEYDPANFTDAMREYIEAEPGEMIWRDAVPDKKDALATALERPEAGERNHIERKYIDATPNDGYPLRILRAYRADCDMRWNSTTNDGQDATPLMEALKIMQDQRAAILDKAIAALERLEGTNDREVS